jgi:hypothetical protein
VVQAEPFPGGRFFSSRVLMPARVLGSHAFPIIRHLDHQQVSVGMGIDFQAIDPVLFREAVLDRIFNDRLQDELLDGTGLERPVRCPGKPGKAG